MASIWVGVPACYASFRVGMFQHSGLRMAGGGRSCLRLRAASPDALATEIIAQQERWGEFTVVKKRKCPCRRMQAKTTIYRMWPKRLRRAHQMDICMGIRNCLSLDLSRRARTNFRSSPFSILSRSAVEPIANISPRATAGSTAGVTVLVPLLACAVRRRRIFRWVQGPPGNRSSRKQSEQSWR
jgi:hypothetical protein